MQATDKNTFTEALEVCFANYREPAPLDGVIDDWMKHLAPYSLMQVGNALEHHKRNSGKVPALSDILNFLPKDASDWPVASVAFSEMLLIESGRFMLTTKEHIGAFEAARPLLEVRDRFNASKAFQERYDAMVTAGKNAGARAAWFVSNSGSDHDGMYRREALRDGARAGRISIEHGKQLAQLLPAEPDKVPEYDENGELAALPPPPQSAKAHSEIGKMRAIMRPDYNAKPARDMSPEIAATRAAKAEQARKLAEYMEAQALKTALAERDAELAALRAALAAKDVA
ncbi:hypothetical protein [Paraburkholderia strydomiana]